MHFQLQISISSLVQRQLTLSAYFTKIKGVWDELMNFKPQPIYTCNLACTCGAIKTLMEYQQQKQIMQFLIGLNESYAQTREQILLLNPLPTLNKVYAMVLAQERQKGLSFSVSDVSAEYTALMSKSVLNSYFVDKQGNYRKDKPICSHCGMTRHVVDKCYKLHGGCLGIRLGIL